MKELNEYDKKAEDFLSKTKTEFKSVFLKYDFHFEGDTEKRDIYLITLKRRDREYKFNFGQSISESGFKIINTNTNKEVKYIWFDECLTYVQQFKGEQKEKEIKRFVSDKLKCMGCLKLIFGKTPTSYDVLACLTTYDPEDFESFCSNFGYDIDSRRAEKTYNGVVDEYNNLKMLFSDKELEELQEIN